MDLRPKFNATPPVKVMFNIGACMDIPTGEYLTGKYGESILNGGLGFVTGMVGTGNNFKSTISHYMVLSAMSKIWWSVKSALSTYDTEINIHESRLKYFVNQFPEFEGMDLIDNSYWIITDRSKYYANEWYEIYKEHLKDKVKNADKYSVVTPFLDRDKTNLKIIAPTFTEVDSFSRFETEDVGKLQDDNELGESGGNTIHMRQGLAKKRFLMEAPTLTASSYNYLILTAHVGKEIQMATGPMAPPPTKKLHYLKNGDKLKGVTDDFFFLTHNCWQAVKTEILMNQNTKAPEYPKDANDDLAGDTDLNAVTLRQLRSKSGPSGYQIEVIVSQRDGVLPSMTEFHNIKNSGRFGISGTLQHYSLDLYPDKKVQRTTVRSVIDSDPKFRRALNITSELLQIYNFYNHYEEGFVCSPKVLYDDLKEKGYDWDILLQTRSYWTINNDKHPVPFLSTMDLLNMRAGTYHPYWLDSDKKTIKKPK